MRKQSKVLGRDLEGENGTKNMVLRNERQSWIENDQTYRTVVLHVSENITGE